MAKKQSGGGGNGRGAAVVLKIDLHCEGCAGRIVKAVRSLDGVDSVRIGENELKTVKVIGEIDPVKLRQKVEEKTKKKVELISPSNGGENNHRSGGGGEQKKQQKQAGREKTAAVKGESKPKELPVTTAVLKVPLHCQGCIQKIQKLVKRTKGLMEMSIDTNKDLVTVKGQIDVKIVIKELRDKFKRNVEIVTSKKEAEGDGGDEKKGNTGGKKMGTGGGGKQTGKDSGGGDDGEEVIEGGGKVEGHKMEYHGGQGNIPYLNQYPQYVYGLDYMVNYEHAPQLFSDENPNACVVM